MNHEVPRTDPWGAFCFNVLYTENKFLGTLGGFILNFSFLLDKKDLNQSAFTPQCHTNVIWLTKFHDLHSQKLVTHHRK
jgi:hypothetical protein